ncbi:hypothetical protein [Streptomyces sp. DH12]|uniref:phage tail protein n=1 Tax=Streptomyces sp. DH12 TaxID=2857010 RepID=UPI001E5BA82F|nr:hypothetical protein [Streptomyces sp. DH12]
MALNIGELMGYIRADDSDMQRGLGDAETALGRFQGAMGARLRAVAEAFRSAGASVGGALGEGFDDAAERGRASVASLAKAIGGLSAGVPAVAAVATAVGGLVAAFAGAGIAAKAFQMAAGPQLEAVTEASEAAEKAEEAHAEATRKKAAAQKLAAKGGDEYKAALKEAEAATKRATEADALYKEQLEEMPPATREMSKALTGLKDDHQKWSDSLASSTMPVFTKGINILRSLLPMLTPFVKQAAEAFGDFLDKVAKGIKSARFKEWAAETAAGAGRSLRDFLTVLGNLGRGFGGLLSAFKPASDGVTGGLVRMSAAFAEWGTNLKGSAGFEKFLEVAREGAATLALLAGAVFKVVRALAPLLGATVMVAQALGRLIQATPQPVLTALVTTLAAVKLGMMAYGVGAAAVAAANTVMASTAWVAIAGWTRMMAVGLMAYASTAGAAVAAAATTAAAWVGSALVAIGTWTAAVVRAGAMAVAQFTLMAARAVVWAATMAAQWLIAMGPIGWIIAAVVGLAALIIANWDKIKKWTGQAWDWVWGKVTGITKMLVSYITNLPLVRFFLQHWDRIKQGTVRKILELVNYVRGLPGRIASALSGLGSLLVGKGRDLIRGLWRGIQSMGGWLRSTLIGWAKSAIPGPIAEALGIASPSRVMAEQVGRWIPAGLAEGITGHQGVVDRAMRNLVQMPAMAPAYPSMPSMAPAGAYTASAGGPGKGSSVVVEIRADRSAASNFIVDIIREAVATRGHGSVEATFRR